MQSHTMLHMKKVRKAFQDILAFPEARWPRHCEVVDDSITFQQRWGVALTLQQHRANQLRCPTRLSSLVGGNSKWMINNINNWLHDPFHPKQSHTQQLWSLQQVNNCRFILGLSGATAWHTQPNNHQPLLSRSVKAPKRSFFSSWSKKRQRGYYVAWHVSPSLSVSLSLSPSPRDNMSWLGSFCFWQHLIATCCNSNFGSCTSILWESSYVRSSLVVWDAMYPKSSISVLCFVPFFEVFVPVRPRRDTLWMKKCHCMPCKKPTQHRRHWITLEYVDATAG